MSNEPLHTAPAEAEAPKAESGKKRVDMITSIVLLIFGVFVVTQALDMGIMMQYSPGAGMFPLGIGGLISVLSLSMLVESLNPKTPDKASKFSNKAGMLTSLKLMAGLVAYVALLRPLGYLIMTMALVLYIMKVVEKTKTKTALLVAFSVTLLLFLIFQVGLKVTLPKSPFGF